VGLCPSLAITFDSRFFIFLDDVPVQKIFFLPDQASSGSVL